MAGAAAGAKNWAVLIGINGYHESLGTLKYSVNDCRRVAEVLTAGESGFPAERARRQIWEANLIGRPLAPDVALDELVSMTDGYSGADIRAICERGAQDAFLDSVDPGSKGEDGDGGAPVRFITQAHLRAAVAAVPRSVNEKLAAQHRKFRVSREG